MSFEPSAAWKWIAPAVGSLVIIIFSNKTFNNLLCTDTTWHIIYMRTEPVVVLVCTSVCITAEIQV